jgi:hypothetical protein
MEIDGNEMVDQLARQGSSRPSTNWTWASSRLICKGAKCVIRGWRNYKHEEYWQSIHGQKQAKGFHKRQRAGALLNLSRNQLWTMTGLLRVHCHLKKTSAQTGAGKQSWVWQKKTGIWNGSVWLRGFGCIKVQVPVLTFYATRWLRGKLC